MRELSSTQLTDIGTYNTQRGKRGLLHSHPHLKHKNRFKMNNENGENFWEDSI